MFELSEIHIGYKFNYIIENEGRQQYRLTMNNIKRQG